MPKGYGDYLKCGAKTHSGEPCKHATVPGSKRCRLHGGVTPRGLESANLIHGRYSKFLPKRLLARYEESEADSELLNLRSEISLMDARLEDLLRKVDTGESGALWRSIHLQYEDLEFAIKAQDAGLMSVALSGMKNLIGRAQSDYACWRELQVCLEQRRRLVDSEGKRLQMMQQYITTEQAMLLLTQIVASVKQHVLDPVALQAVSRDLVRLAGPRRGNGDMDGEAA